MLDQYQVVPVCTRPVLHFLANPLKRMVGLEGIEPPTHGLGNRCSIRLSYRPMVFRIAYRARLGGPVPGSVDYSSNDLTAASTVSYTSNTVTSLVIFNCSLKRLVRLASFKLAP